MFKALFVLVSFLSSSAIADFKGRVTTTYTCSESEGPANWSVTIIEDSKTKDSWASVKYEVHEVDCEDVANRAQVGLRCHPTGGSVVVSSSKVHFESCETAADQTMLCKKMNAGRDRSYIRLQSDKLSFALTLEGENSELLKQGLDTVTESSADKARVARVSDCKKTVTKVQN